MTKIILGSYTKKDSKGIYTTELDEATGKLSAPSFLLNAVGPTYLTTDKNQNLYTIDKVGEEAGITGYFLNNDTYEKTSGFYAEGAAPCYVGYDEARHFIYTANYHKGEVAVFRVDEHTGTITEALDKVYHEGHSVHENQTQSHVHYTDLVPDGRLMVCDLGTDEVYVYDVNDATGKLTEVSRHKTEPGFGPRHLVFHPNQKTVYIIGELGSKIETATYENGTLTKHQVVSTLAADFTGDNGCGAIRVSQDGKFLYASNRGEDTIVVYQISEDTLSLKVVQRISTEGSFPRDFALSPSEKYLVCANQNTGDLTLYTRDAAEGILTTVQKNVPAPECVCVHFM